MTKDYCKETVFLLEPINMASGTLLLAAHWANAFFPLSESGTRSRNNLCCSGTDSNICLCFCPRAEIWTIWILEKIILTHYVDYIKLTRHSEQEVASRKEATVTCAPEGGR